MSGDRLQKIANGLTVRLNRDVLIEKSLSEIQGVLQSDRAVLYNFYRKWQGQVTCETLSAIELSILGSTGLWGLLIAHQCSGPRIWLRSDIEFMQQQAQNMAMSPTIQDS
jgi:GAF domain-containing protein